MSVRDALVERARKTSEAPRKQVRAYIGANDYWYERARRQPSVVRAVQDLPAKVRKLTADGVDVAGAVQPLKPANLRHAVEDRAVAARQRRSDLAERGESIIQDWKSAAAVKDVEALVKAVRSADGVAEIAKSLRSWVEEFPAATTPSAKPARKPAAKAATTKPVPRKAPARKRTATRTLKTSE